MRACRFAAFFLLTLFLVLDTLAAQNVQVNSAVPDAAAQGTINLNIAIGGNGFKRGAKSEFFISGTNNAGGIKVNSTSFVSSTQVTANVDVADAASIANFDIVVRNTDGRSGKGTGLFKVLAKGSQVCVLPSLPSNFSLVTTLNDSVPSYTGLAASVRVSHVTLGGRDVLVAAVGTIAIGGKLHVFLLDPLTGALLDGTAIGTNTVPQPHIAKTVILADGSTMGMHYMAIGDVNADGIPDIAVAKGGGGAFAFVGQVDANGILSYSEKIAFPAAPGQSTAFGTGVAMGNVNGAPGDEIAISDAGAGKGGNFRPGGVFIYRYNGSGFTLLQTVNQPSLAVALGDVIGDSSPDLIVGANGGNVFVYPGPSFTSSFTMPPGPRVRTARVLGGAYADLISAPFGGLGGSQKRVDVFSGPVSSGQTPAFTLFPIEVDDLDLGDINGDGLADVLIGASNTSPSNACPDSVGTGYVYLSNTATPTQPSLYTLAPPTPDMDFGGYGWSIAAASGTRIFLVGETGRNINGVTNAGQVYVYKVN